MMEGTAPVRCYDRVMSQTPARRVVIYGKDT
jgi:hypothetical protein